MRDVTSQGFLVRDEKAMTSNKGNVMTVKARWWRVTSWCVALASIAFASIANAASSPADALRGLLSPRPMAAAAGQSATQLADGRWLLLGGSLNGQAVSNQAVVLDARSGQSVVLPTRLAIPRSGHSASLLPDGRVLVLGGTGSNGVVLADAERFDPTTQGFETLGNLGLIPRVGHTGTVLTDGRLLVIGGADARGNPIYDAELLDPLSLQLVRFDARLDVAQLNHVAALLPSSDVLIWGGIDGAGRPTPTGELFSSSAQRFAPVSPQATAQLAQSLASAIPPALLDSQPAANARDVPVSQRILVRLNTRMDVSTLNAGTVTLIGPSGSTAIKPVAVEGGLLLFVTPTQELLPASAYTLFIQGAMDQFGQALPFTALGFNTASLGGSASASSARASSSMGIGGIALNGSGGNLDAATPAAAKPDPAAERAQGTSDDVDNEEWIPDASNRKLNWRSGRALLARQFMPNRESLRRVLHDDSQDAPKTWALLKASLDSKKAAANRLAATPGTTALAGQVLRLNGRPLANVTVKIGSISTKTDDNGEFLLTNLTSGNSQLLIVDGGTANRPNATYGRFTFLANIVPDQTNDLPFVVWMPKLDMRHAVNIPSPTTRETVISNPNIPGLELVLPAGAVLRDADGKIVTQVTITPMPVDQTPFPMPFLDVPVYFTLQPGGTVIQGVDGKPKGALLRYPNYSPFGPGSLVKLFDYDPNGRGWYVYGAGNISPDGQKVIGPRDFVIYQFTANGVSSGGTSADAASPSANSTCGETPANSGPASNNAGGNSCNGSSAGPSGVAAAGDPVDLFNGFFSNIETDITVQDVVPIVWTRTYRTLDKFSGSDIVRPFGYGSTNPYEVFLEFLPNYSGVNLVMPDSTRIFFANIVPGSTYATNHQNTNNPGQFNQAILHYDNASSSGITLYFRDGRKWGFPAHTSRVLWMEDRNGNRTTFTRTGGYVTRVTGPTGRYLDVAYTGGNLISQVQDQAGRTVSYAYSGNRLSTVTDPNGGVRTYTWDTVNNRITSIQDARSHTILTLTYDGNGRVATETLADSSTFSFAYTLTSGVVTRTEVTDRRGKVRRVDFNSAGYITTNTFPLGLTEEQVTSYTLDATTGRYTSVTDPLSRLTDFTYDSLGNVTQVTKLAGTGGAVSTNWTYDTTYSLPLTVVDPNSKTTTFTYDTKGNLTQVSAPLSHTTQMTYDINGNQLTHVEGGGVVTSDLRRR